jgi:hypothetical protein
MKKRIAKTIAILSLLVMLSMGASNVSAFPCARCMPTIQWCNGCTPAVQYAVSSSPQNANHASVPDLGDREMAPAAQPESSFSFALYMARLAMSFWYLF